jgi:hypothetical protein
MEVDDAAYGDVSIHLFYFIFGTLLLFLFSQDSTSLTTVTRKQNRSGTVTKLGFGEGHIIGGLAVDRKREGGGYWSCVKRGISTGEHASCFCCFRVHTPRTGPKDELLGWETWLLVHEAVPL